MASAGDDGHSSATGDSRLRPVERAMRKLADDGMAESDIAWRFKRSPGHVRRVLDMSEIPRRSAPQAEVDEDLRPIERVVMRAREDGVDTAEIAARLRRSPRNVAQIEKLAAYKLEQLDDGPSD